MRQGKQLKAKILKNKTTFIEHSEGCEIHCENMGEGIRKQRVKAYEGRTAEREWETE